jgi:hypothetical protein
VPTIRCRLAFLFVLVAALSMSAAGTAFARSRAHQARHHAHGSYARVHCSAHARHRKRHTAVNCRHSRRGAPSKASRPAAAPRPASTVSVAARSHTTTSGHPNKGPQPTVESPPANVSPPAVSGSAVEGNVLSAEAGSWTGTTPMQYAYRWQRNGIDIAGASGSSYTLTSADVGDRLDVVVSASNTVGSSAASSPATAIVAAAPLAPSGPAASVNAAPTGPGVPEGGWHIAFADGFGAPLGTGPGQDNFFYPNENACCNPYENHHGDNTNELEAYNGIQDHITPGGLELVNSFHPNAMPAEGSYPVRNYLSGSVSTRPQYEAGGWHGFTWEPGGGETWAFECDCKLPSNYPKYSGTDPGWWSTDKAWTNEFDFFESWGWNCNPLTSCGFGIAWVYNTSPLHTEESALYGLISKLFDPAAAYHRYTTVIYPNNTWSEYIDGQLQTWVGNAGVAPAPPEFKRVQMSLLLTNAIRDSSGSTGPNPYPEFSTAGETRTFDVRSIAVYQDGAHAGRNVTGGGVAPGTTVN